MQLTVVPVGHSPRIRGGVGAACHSLLFSGKPEGELRVGVHTSPSSCSTPASPSALPEHSSSSLPRTLAGDSGKSGRAPRGRGEARGLRSRQGGRGSLWATCSSSPGFLFSGMPAPPAVRGPVLRADERATAVNVFATEQDKQYPEPCFFLPAASPLRQATGCLPLFPGPRAPLLVFPFLSWPSRLAQLMG